MSSKLHPYKLVIAPKVSLLGQARPKFANSVRPRSPFRHYAEPALFQDDVNPRRHCSRACNGPRVVGTMTWPFGPSGSGDGSKDDDEAKKQRVSWATSLGSLPRDHFAAAREWAPMVLFSLAGLGALQLYANYLRRIPGADYVRPSFFRSRSLFGRVTSVGDGDGFHLFHTPGGRAVGWGWVRRVPETRKELRDRTVRVLGRIASTEGLG